MTAHPRVSASRFRHPLLFSDDLRLASTPFLSIRVLPLYLHFFFVFLLYYLIIHSPCFFINISIAILQLSFSLKFFASFLLIYISFLTYFSLIYFFLLLFLILSNYFLFLSFLSSLKEIFLSVSARVRACVCVCVCVREYVCLIPFSFGFPILTVWE